MGKVGRIAVVVALLAVVAVVISRKEGARPPTTGQTDTAPAATGLPRMVELGSVTCVPCKMMASILEELRKEYAGRLQVDFIDVQPNKAAGKAYGVRFIPTQVFFDASGKELFRHEGFFAKDDILAKWRELGVDLSGEVD